MAEPIWDVWICTFGVSTCVFCKMGHTVTVFEEPIA